MAATFLVSSEATAKSIRTQSSKGCLIISLNNLAEWHGPGAHHASYRGGGSVTRAAGLNDSKRFEISNSRSGFLTIENLGPVEKKEKLREQRVRFRDVHEPRGRRTEANGRAEVPRSGAARTKFAHRGPKEETMSARLDAKGPSHSGKAVRMPHHHSWLSARSAEQCPARGRAARE